MSSSIADGWYTSRFWAGIVILAPIPPAIHPIPCVFGKKITEPLMEISMRWEENIYFNTFGVTSLDNYTVYNIVGMRELLLCLALNCFLMHDHIFISLLRFAIACSLFILDCQWCSVYLNNPPSLHLSLLWLCGKGHVMYVTGYH